MFRKISLKQTCASIGSQAFYEAVATVELKKERENIYYDETTKRNVEGESVVYQ